MLQHEYYFCVGRYVNEYTWKHFMTLDSSDDAEIFDKYYSVLTGYGWKDKFAFNPNGEAIYISADGIEYSGIWFETDKKRIAVFRTEKST